MNFTKIVPIVVLVLSVFLLSDTFFTVRETEQALIVQFGQYKRSVQEAGLQFKIPFIQDVIRIDKRVLDADPPIEQVILADQKRLDVDAFARYRITKPLEFYQSVASEAVVEQRLSSIVRSSLRRVLGSVTLLEILSEDRVLVMEEIRDQVNQEAQRFGIEIVDVRIRRADLPEETSQAIFARMRSEREREAAEARAQGQEESQRTRASADRDRTVILAESQRLAQETRGEGDREALKIMAEATSQDPHFYSFYRSLQAYRTTMKSDNTTFVLSPIGDFFEFFGKISATPDGEQPESVPLPSEEEEEQTP